MPILCLDKLAATVKAAYNKGCNVIIICTACKLGKSNF